MSSDYTPPTGAAAGDVTLAGAQTITGIKTFAADPVFNDGAIPEAKVAGLVVDLAAKATDSLVVHLAGAETITGAKTFNGNVGFYATPAVAQPSGSSDVLAGLVTQGLRGASSNPPLNLGSGALTAGITRVDSAAAGTAATPGLLFGSDTTTGFYLVSANNIGVTVSGNNKWRWGSTAIVLADGYNFLGGTSTGHQFLTGTTQKAAWYGATPVAQRAGAAQAAVAGTAATNVAPFGYSTQAQADAIVTLVNELRAWAVAWGVIKGSA